jgi:hypothetical protein
LTNVFILVTVLDKTIQIVSSKQKGEANATCNTSKPVRVWFNSSECCGKPDSALEVIPGDLDDGVSVTDGSGLWLESMVKGSSIVSAEFGHVRIICARDGLWSCAYGSAYIMKA